MRYFVSFFAHAAGESRHGNTCIDSGFLITEWEEVRIIEDTIKEQSLEKYPDIDSVTVISFQLLPQK
jgi:hypothetical protein